MASLEGLRGGYAGKEEPEAATVRPSRLPFDLAARRSEVARLMGIVQYVEGAAGSQLKVY